MLKPAETGRTVKRLVAVTVALTALTILHDLDHVRQGRSLAVHLDVVGAVSLVSLAVTLIVLRRRHPLAGMVAVAQGIATVVGVGVVHAAPYWSSLADSYGAAHVDALSWAVILAMMAAGAVLAVLAWPTARRPNLMHR
ncbi:MAG TPA: hypothetical protein VF244_07985 [Acidimicrobiales bacterium]